MSPMPAVTPTDEAAVPSHAPSLLDRTIAAIEPPDEAVRILTDVATFEEAAVSTAVR